MKIRTTQEASAAGVMCAHCGARATGAHALFVHIADNPPDGRPNINRISPGFQFCSMACRSLWWETPTNEQLFRPITSEHTISATVVHVDPDTKHLSVFVEDDAGQLLAEQSGAPAGHYRFAGHGALEAWWSGDVEGVPVELPMVEPEDEPKAVP